MQALNVEKSKDTKKKPLKIHFLRRSLQDHPGGEEGSCGHKPHHQEYQLQGQLCKV